MSRSRDDFSPIRQQLTHDISSRHLDLIEKAGLSLDKRGISTAHPCTAMIMGSNIKLHVVAVSSQNTKQITILSSVPFEVNQKVILKRTDHTGKKSFVEGVIKNSRSGMRPDDKDKQIFVSLLDVHYGHC